MPHRSNLHHPFRCHLHLGYLDTWMSQPDPDSEVVELSIQLSGLSITVRGSPARAVDFVRGLSDQIPPTSEHHGYLQWTPGTPASSVASCVSSSVETRCSIASAFPNCPAHWIGLASSRLSGSRISGADRARQAWLAGCWAKAVADGWKDQRRCVTLFVQRRRAGSILRRLASSTHRLKIRSNDGSGEVHCRHLHALCAGDACFGKGRGWHCSRSGFGGYQKALRNPFRYFTADALEDGHQAGPDDLIGPSIRVVECMWIWFWWIWHQIF